MSRAMIAKDAARPERPWNEEDPIPMSEWGRDHWSTLAYAETRCVDHGGELANDHMRTNPRRHRKLLGPSKLFYGIEGPGYPTRLISGAVIVRHDDWDCLNDAVAAGLLEVLSEVDRKPSQAFGGMRVRVRLTADGEAACAALRMHKGRGGNFGNFSDFANERE